MKNSLSAVAAAAFLGLSAQPAYAQFVVSDPVAEASEATTAVETAAIDAQLATANVELAAINRATTATNITQDSMLAMMKAPTVIAGGFAGMDGGAKANVLTQASDFMSTFDGGSSTNVPAGLIYAQGKIKDLNADELKGIATGNSEELIADRQWHIGTNVQGQALSDMKMYATGYNTADLMEAKLAPTDLKSAVVWGDGINLQVLKAINLLGQSVSLNTATLAETLLQTIKHVFQQQDDHAKTAKMLAASAVVAAPVVAGIAIAATP